VRALTLIVGSCTQLFLCGIAGSQASTNLHADDVLAAHRLQPQPERPRPITAAELVELRDIGGHVGTLSLSPNQRFVAFVIQQASLKTNSYRTALYAKDLSSAADPIFLGSAGPVRLGVSAGRVAGYLSEPLMRWSPDGEWVALLRGVGGDAQVWRFRRDGGSMQQVTWSTIPIVDFRWSRSGSELIYETEGARGIASGENHQERARGYLFDHRFWPDYSVMPAGLACNGLSAFGLSTRQLPACQRGYHAIHVETGAQRDASDDEQRLFETMPDAAPVSNAGPPTNRRLRGDLSLWIENLDPDRFRGFAPPRVIAISGPASPGGPRRCRFSLCVGNVQNAWWVGSQRPNVMFVRNEGHGDRYTAIYEWDTLRNRVRRILRTDARVTGCQQSGKRLICFRETPTQPRSIVAIELRSGDIQTIVDPNPHMRQIALTRVEALEWTDAFGNATFGHLVYPATYKPGMKFPLVIVQYRSRGFLRGGVGNEYPIHLFAAQGFFVLSFDAPQDADDRATLHGEEFEARSWQNFYERRRSFSALENILSTLIERGQVDPRRIGITGLSDGAETVSFALIHSDRYRAAIASDALWHPSLYHIANRDFRRYVKRYIGMPDDSRWREISLGLNAERIQTPLLLNVADHELLATTMNFTQLEDAGSPVEMHVFPDEYHNKWQPIHRYSIYRRNLQWMLYWLQNVEMPDAVDRDQYSRWAKLRGSSSE
jgi:dipeptidyl aminopeptidase/acylaminoacyl peptidase